MLATLQSSVHSPPHDALDSGAPRQSVLRPPWCRLHGISWSSAACSHDPDCSAVLGHFWTHCFHLRILCRYDNACRMNRFAVGMSETNPRQVATATIGWSWMSSIRWISRNLQQNRSAVERSHCCSDYHWSYPGRSEIRQTCDSALRLQSNNEGIWKGKLIVLSIAQLIEELTCNWLWGICCSESRDKRQPSLTTEHVDTCSTIDGTSLWRNPGRFCFCCSAAHSCVLECFLPCFRWTARSTEQNCKTELPSELRTKAIARDCRTWW